MQSDRNVSMTSDSSDSVAEVTNVEKNIFSVLRGARALVGSSSQPPKIADSENKIRKNFRKSIIKRAVHPSIICSTPFHSEKAETRKSFENISTISDIGSDNSRILPVIEENGCEENPQQNQKNVSKEVSQLLDHTDAHCENKIVGNSSRNTSIQVDVMKDISLRSNRKGDISACSKQDQKNLTGSGKENKVNSRLSKQHILDEILGLSTSKLNDNKLDITEKNIVHDDLKEVHVDQHEDNSIPDNVQVESKIVTAHTTTDDEEVIIDQSPRQEEKRNISVTNQKKSSIHGVLSTEKPSFEVVEHSKIEMNSEEDEAILKTRPIQQKIRNTENLNNTRRTNVSINHSRLGQFSEAVEFSDMEIHSRSKRKASKTRSKQDKRKITEEYHESSPPKKNKTAYHRGQSSTRSRTKSSNITHIQTEESENSSESDELETDNMRTAEKTRFSRKKGYNNEDDQLNVRNKLKGKKIPHKEERFRSTKRKQYNSDEEDEQKIRTKKMFREPERNKSSHRIDYSSNVDETELSEEPKLRKKNILGKKGTKYSSDEESEESRIRDKKRVPKRGTSNYYDRRGFSSNEEEIEMNEEHELMRHKSKQRAKSLRRKEYSSDEEDSEYIEVHKVRGKSIIRRIESSKNCNRKKYTDFEENRNKEYKRGPKVPQELVRVKSSKNRIHHSPEISEDDRRSTRKFSQKQGRSKSTIRKSFRNPGTSRDSNQKHNAVEDKFIFKRPRSKSSKRLEYYTPEESSNCFDEVSYNSDTPGEIRKVRQSKKILYVVETNSTASDLDEQKLVKGRHRSVSQKKYKLVHDTEQKLKKKLKTKGRIIEVISEGSDIEEDFTRKSIRVPSRHKSKGLERVRPSSSKPYAVYEDECESPSPRKNSNAKKHGRLSRRDSYVLRQMKNKRSTLKMRDQSSMEPPDPNHENFVTPVNQKITVQQPGMTTIIRGIVDQQLAKYNKAKEINVSIKESDKTTDRIQIPNEEIEEAPNIDEDDEIQIVSEDNSNDDQAVIPTENSHKNISSNHIRKLSGINIPDDPLNAGQSSEISEFSNGLSISSLLESIKAVNFTKHGDLANFEPIGSAKILQRLARRPHADISKIHTSISVPVRNQPKKPKKKLIDIIGSLIETKSVQKDIVDVSVQTSLPGTKTNVAELTPEIDIQVHTVKDVPHESENVATSTVKSSRIPVMCKRRISRPTSTTREDGPVENLAAQEEDIHEALDQDGSSVPSAEVPAKGKNRTHSNTSHIRDDSPIEMEPLEVEVNVQKHLKSDEDCRTEENKQDLSIVKARKGKVENQKRDSKTKSVGTAVMASYEDDPKETPEKSERRTSRYTLNSKGYDGIEMEPTDMVPPSIQNDPDQDVSIAQSERVLERSKRRTRRYTLNFKEDDRTDVGPTPVEKSFSDQDIEKNRKGMRRSTKEDDDSKLDPTDLAPQGDNIQTPLNSKSRTTSRRLKTREDDGTKMKLVVVLAPEDILTDQDVSFKKPEESLNKSKRRTRRSALTTKEDDAIEVELRDSTPQQNMGLTSDQDELAVEVAQKSRITRRNTTEEDDAIEVELRDSMPEDNLEPASDQDLPVVKQEEAAQKSRRKIQRRTLNSKEDYDGTVIKPASSENSELTSDQAESVKQPEKVPEQSKRRTRGSMSNTKENENEMYSTDFTPQEESTEIIADQNEPFVKPFGIPLKSKKKGRASRAMEKTTNEDGQDTLDSKSSNTGKILIHYDNVLSKRKSESTTERNKKKGKASKKGKPQSTDEEGPTLRRSAREKKTADPYWWSDILGIPAGFNQKKANRRDTTTDSSSIGSTKKRGRPKKTTQEANRRDTTKDSSSISPTKKRGRPKKTTNATSSRKKETEEQKSRLTDEENTEMEYNELEKNYVTETPSLSIEPNEENKLKSKQIKKKQETRSRKQETEERKNRLTNEENSDMEYNELETNYETETPSTSKKNIQETKLTSKQIKGQSSRSTYGENEGNDDLDTNNETETPSTIKSTTKKKKRQRLTVQVKKLSKKKDEKRKLACEDNDDNDERSNALETSAEMSQKLTEFYNNSIEGNLTEENPLSCRGLDEEPTTSIDKWYHLDKVKNTIGLHTNETYMVGETCGYFALAPGQKLSSVNKQYEMVYIKLEGAITMIMERVKYPKMPNSFIVPKGVPAHFQNIGVGRALFFVILR